jgi:hypothetical protein
MVLARVKESKMYSIELDCPPGFPRPSDLLPHVISETGLVLDPSLQAQFLVIGNGLFPKIKILCTNPFVI